MNVLLVNPSRQFRAADMEPLGLGYLAATLRRAGHQAVILDAPSRLLEVDRVVEVVGRERFDLLGLSVPFQYSLEETLRFVERLRAEGVDAHITVGGHPPTFQAAEILSGWPGVDSVVRGEGEETIVELADRLNSRRDWSDVAGLALREGGKVRVNPGRPLIEDLDGLAWPVRDDQAKLARPWFSVSSSRGCYAQCSFCTVASFYREFPGRRWRGRSPDSVVGEIEQRVRELGINRVFFIDDNFVGPGRRGRERARLIGEGIAKRLPGTEYYISCRATDVHPELFAELKKTGLVCVFLGIESGHQGGLDLYDKATTVEQNRRAIETLRALDLQLDIGFILLTPYSTLAGIREDLSFVREAGCGTALQCLTRLEVSVGMPIYDRIKDDGLLAQEGYRFRDPRVEALAGFMQELKKDVAPVLMNVMKLHEAAKWGSDGQADNGIDRRAEELRVELEGLADKTVNEAISRLESSKGPFAAEINDLRVEQEGRVSRLKSAVEELSRRVRGDATGPPGAAEKLPA